ncbi:methyl-accepting chemotaxis protein [Pantoea agglomerans]|uniref:methyl-accepting chemotaxis protein n=1 Tax=Enterobacter agglomerans TaxID=549 RepID=UPI0037CCBD4E
MNHLKLNNYFMNFKVGTKLGMGFLVVIGALIITALVASGCLDTIQDNSARRSLTIEMNSTFGTARLNRTLYQYTNEQQYADKNAEALKQLRNQYNKLAQFNWDSGGKTFLDGIEEAMNRYGTQRNILVNYMQRMMGMAASLQQLPYLSLAKSMDYLAEGGTLASDTSSLLERLSSQLKEVNLQLLTFIKVPEDNSRAALNIALGDARKTAVMLEEAKNPALSEVTTSAFNLIDKVSSSVSPFETLWSAHHVAAKTLVGRGEDFDASLARMFDYQKKISSDFIKMAQIKIAFLSLLAVIISILFAWRITLSIKRPLSQALFMARRISEGDLTPTTLSYRKDELGLLMQAFDNMRIKLEEIINNVRNGVSNVNSAATEIAMGNEDLSSRTEQQAAAVVQTAASIEQLTSTVKLNSENAICASKLAGEASSQATQGGQVVSGVVNTMEQIRKSSSRISEITQVINGIAFQTNILALNAAVEAARAGEDGRGFAVVAGEVRNLAQRSATAAKEIEGLILESVGQVNTGAAQVENAGKTMQSIIDAVAQVNEVMKEIATASDEQNRGISQVSQAMTEMDSTTQQNAALVEQSAAAAGSLQEEAGRLEQAVAFFKTESVLVSSVPTATIRKQQKPVTATSHSSAENWQSF